MTELAHAVKNQFESDVAEAAKPAAEVVRSSGWIATLLVFVAVLIGIEGGHAIEDSLDLLRAFWVSVSPSRLDTRVIDVLG